MAATDISTAIKVAARCFIALEPSIPPAGPGQPSPRAHRVLQFHHRHEPKGRIPLALRDESCPHTELERWQRDVVEERGKLIGGHAHISKCPSRSSANYGLNGNGQHTHRRLP